MWTEERKMTETKTNVLCSTFYKNMKLTSRWNLQQKSNRHYHDVSSLEIKYSTKQQQQHINKTRQFMFGVKIKWQVPEIGCFFLHFFLFFFHFKQFCLCNIYSLLTNLVFLYLVERFASFSSTSCFVHMLMTIFLFCFALHAAVAVTLSIDFDDNKWCVVSAFPNLSGKEYVRSTHPSTFIEKEKLVNNNAV